MIVHMLNVNFGLHVNGITFSMNIMVKIFAFGRAK